MGRSKALVNKCEDLSSDPPQNTLKSDAVVLAGSKRKTVNKRINTPSSTVNWPDLWIAHPASKQGKTPQVSLCEDACTTAQVHRETTHKHTNYTHSKTHTQLTVR